MQIMKYTRIIVRGSLVVLPFFVVFTPCSAATGDSLPASAVLMKAMVDELDRSVSELTIEDLPRPYFIQYTAEDRLIHTIRAAY